MSDWEGGGQRSPRSRAGILVLMLVGVGLGAFLVGGGDGTGGDPSALEISGEADPAPTEARPTETEPSEPEPTEPEPTETELAQSEPTEVEATETAEPSALPVADGTWSQVPPLPLVPREDGVSVWTGSELLVWGGQHWPQGPPYRREFFADGALLDPATGRWREVAQAPLEPRAGAAAVWTGSEVVVWGGEGTHGFFADGAAYDPATDRWRMLPDGLLTARSGAAAVWTGTEMLLVSGRDNAGGLADGAAHNPADGTWRMLSGEFAPGMFYSWGGFDGLWDGSRALFWSEDNESGQETQAAYYDPRAGDWSLLPNLPLAVDGSLRDYAWTGEMLLAVRWPWGGRTPLISELLPGADEWTDVDLPSTADSRLGRSTTGRPTPVVWAGDRLHVLDDMIGWVVREGDSWLQLPLPPAGELMGVASAEPLGDAVLVWTGQDALGEPVVVEGGWIWRGE